MRYAIYTTYFHGGGCIWEGDNLRQALRFRASSDCECGCRGAPIWADCSLDDLRKDAEAIGATVTPPYEPDGPHVVGGHEVYLAAAPRQSMRDIEGLAGNSYAFVRAD